MGLSGGLSNNGGVAVTGGAVDQPGGVAGLDANTLLKLAEFPSTIVELLNGAQSPASYPVAQLPTLLVSDYAKSTDLHAGTTLSAATGTSAGRTSIQVPALANKLPEFSWVQLNDGAGNVQNVQLTGVGADQGTGGAGQPVATKSFTPVVNFPIGSTVRWLDWGPALYRATQAAQTVNLAGAIVMLPGHAIFVGTTLAGDGAQLQSGGINLQSGASGAMMLVGQGWGVSKIYLTTQVTTFMSCGANGAYALFGAVNATVDFTNVNGQSLAGSVLAANVRAISVNHAYFDLQVVNAGPSATSQVSCYSLCCNWAFSDVMSPNSFNEVPHGWYAIRFITIRGEIGLSGGGGRTGTFVAGFCAFDQSVGAAGKYVMPQTMPLFGDFIDVDVKYNGAPNGYPTAFNAATGFQLGGDGFFQRVTVRGWYKGAGDDNELDSVADADVDAVILDSTNMNLLYSHAHSNTPLTVLTGTSASLSVALTSGVAPASLTVLALRAVLAAGSTVTVWDYPAGAHSQTYTVAANPATFDGSWLPVAEASAGTATVVTLTAPANANFSYPAGSPVLLGQVAISDGPSARIRIRVRSIRGNDTGAPFGGTSDPQHICLYGQQNAVLPNVTFDDVTCDTFTRTGAIAAPLQIAGRIRKIEGSIRINDRTTFIATADNQTVAIAAATLQLTGYRTDLAGLKIDHRLDGTIDKAGHTGLSYTVTAMTLTCSHAEVDLYLVTDAKVQVIDSVGGGTITTLRYQQMSAFGISSTNDTFSTGGYPGNTSSNYVTVNGAGQTPGVSGTLVLAGGSGNSSSVSNMPTSGTATVVGSTLPFSYTSIDYVNKTLHGVYGGDPGYTTTGGEHVVYASGALANDWVLDNGLKTTGAAAMGTLDQVYLTAGTLKPAPGADSGVSEAAPEFRFVRLGSRATFLNEVGPSHDDCQAASFTPDAGVASHVGYVFSKWVDGQAPGAATNSVGVIGRANGPTDTLDIVTSNAGSNTTRLTTTLAPGAWSGTTVSGTTAVTGLTISSGPTPAVGSTYKVTGTNMPASATLTITGTGTTGTLNGTATGSGTNTITPGSVALTNGTAYFIRLFVQGNVATLQYFNAVSNSNNAAISATPDVAATFTLTGSDATTLGDQRFGYGGIGVVFGGANATVNQSTYYPMHYVGSWRAVLRATRTQGFTSSSRGVSFSGDGQQVRVNGRLQFVDCNFRGLGPGSATELVFASASTTANALQPYVSVTKSRWATPPAAASATLNGTTNVVANMNSYPVMAHVYGFTLTTPFLRRCLLANDTGVRPQWSPVGATFPAQTAATQIAGASGDHSGIRLDPGDGLQLTYSGAGTMVLDPILD